MYPQVCVATFALGPTPPSKSLNILNIRLHNTLTRPSKIHFLKFYCIYWSSTWHVACTVLYCTLKKHLTNTPASSLKAPGQVALPFSSFSRPLQPGWGQDGSAPRNSPSTQRLISSGCFVRVLCDMTNTTQAKQYEKNEKEWWRVRIYRDKAMSWYMPC